MKNEADKIPDFSMRFIVSIDIPKLKKNTCSSMNKPKKKKKPKDITSSDTGGSVINVMANRINLFSYDGLNKNYDVLNNGNVISDDEQMKIDLGFLPYEIVKIVFALSIYDTEFKGHDFSMVKNVYFRVVNQDTHNEIFRFELDNELQGNEGLIIGELERIGMEWVFRAIGDTVEGGLATIAKNYDVFVAEDVQA